MLRDRTGELSGVAEEQLQGMLVLHAGRELPAAAAELRGRPPVDEVEPGLARPGRRIEVVELRVDGEQHHQRQVRSIDQCPGHAAISHRE